MMMMKMNKVIKYYFQIKFVHKEWKFGQQLDIMI